MGLWQARAAAVLWVGMAVGAVAPAWAGKMVEAVRQRDQLVVGVSTGVPGFSAADSQGRWSGLDVDLARAVAAAVLGDANKVKWVPLASAQRFAALQSGEVDLLSRNTTVTLTRDAGMGLAFTAVAFYDGQGFMVPAKLKVKSAQQLRNATVCVQSGTTSEKNLADFSRAHKLGLKPVVFEKFDAANAAYFAGRCQAYTTDASGLAAVRAREARDPKAHVILPDLISKEPLGPLVRRGDEEWTTVVRWVLHGLVEAEELGVTQANVDQLLTESTDPAVLRLLGKGEDLGKPLGLDKDWMVRAIKAVGHYGQIYERNVGEATPVGLPRGRNRLWKDGGLMYALPLR
ncbi:amino acid ABC transporter substrate-binding protein [Ideonella livida]|uniref:Amino acid ABC transporter substrate-binding protein n=1 Tax=Ideonella livida TaxID=2707176 RepID=A0A7C9TI23_9BURK|nr:amino acid ABC transporter substrate-binding protein [Ideonella livida]NDY90920.1 amino acid ABC transporter substrate-binding protein [Ideonella livida]